MKRFGIVLLGTLFSALAFFGNAQAQEIVLEHTVTVIEVNEQQILEVHSLTTVTEKPLCGPKEITAAEFQPKACGGRNNTLKVEVPAKHQVRIHLDSNGEHQTIAQELSVTIKISGTNQITKEDALDTKSRNFLLIEGENTGKEVVLTNHGRGEDRGSVRVYKTETWTVILRKDMCPGCKVQQHFPLVPACNVAQYGDHPPTDPGPSHGSGMDCPYWDVTPEEDQLVTKTPCPGVFGKLILQLMLQNESLIPQGTKQKKDKNKKAKNKKKNKREETKTKKN